ncbi:MAG: SOS response-associated peptidase [Pleurocapsa sp. MO_226.B13]|nr:SOS response-associated peptidase [Pleurocapsa sp. MO_226.B13]
MCGRFSLDTTKTEIAKEFKCAEFALSKSKYNIAPSQNVIVVINAGDRNEAVLMRWGLIPHWVRSLDSWKSNLINARVETVDEKPSFRNGFKKRPCLIPVTGFYEWNKNKQPYYFHTKKGLFALAGIWESWNNLETEEKLLSCTILTTEAKGAIADIHHRMPLVIPSEYYDLWLGNLDGRKELIEALPEVELKLYPVSKTVNSPKNDSPDCIKPIE